MFPMPVSTLTLKSREKIRKENSSAFKTIEELFKDPAGVNGVADGLVAARRA